MSTPGTPFDFEKSLKIVSSYSFIHKYLPVDRHIVRPVAAVLVRAALRISLTPNQLTAVSLILAVAGGIAYAGGTPRRFAWAGILIMLSTIFDSADGMLARTKNMANRFGAFLDLYLDRFADLAVLLGISFGYSRHVQDGRYLIFGLLTIGLYFFQVCLYYIVNIYLGRDKPGEGAEAKSLAVFIFFVLSFFGRLDVVLLLVFLMSLIGLTGRTIRFLRRIKENAAARPYRGGGPTST